MLSDAAGCAAGGGSHTSSWHSLSPVCPSQPGKQRQASTRPLPGPGGDSQSCSAWRSPQRSFPSLQDSAPSKKGLLGGGAMKQGLGLTRPRNKVHPGWQCRGSPVLLGSAQDRTSFLPKKSKDWKAQLSASTGAATVRREGMMGTHPVATSAAGQGLGKALGAPAADPGPVPTQRGASTPPPGSVTTADQETETQNLPSSYQSLKST